MKPGSKKWKNFMAKLYGIGAAVVIVGALFKIQHWPLASFFLILGSQYRGHHLLLLSFRTAARGSRLELGLPGTGHRRAPKGDDFKKEDQRSITEQLDDMLESAKIEPELIASLGRWHAQPERPGQADGRDHRCRFAPPTSTPTA
jgi:gliding motility-associated protein GldL